MSLGAGGQITYFFPTAIANGPGFDFALFENSFSDDFLELAQVAVSSDGVHFVTLPHAYLGTQSIMGFGSHDPTLIFGLAGKYRVGFGTPFDLETLAWHPSTQNGQLDLHAIRYLKVSDLEGDGRHFDSFNHPIYDPYPTQGSAGLDLEAIGILNSELTDPCPH
jgi:hypothetical protein